VTRTQGNRVRRHRFGACQRRSGRIVTYQSRLGIPGLPEATSAQPVEATARGSYITSIAAARELHVLSSTGQSHHILSHRCARVVCRRTTKTCGRQRRTLAWPLSMSPSLPRAVWPAPKRFFVTRTSLNRDTGSTHWRNLDRHLCSYPFTLPSPPSHPSHTPAPRLPSSFDIRVRFRVTVRKCVHDKASGAQLYRGGQYLVRHD